MNEPDDRWQEGYDEGHEAGYDQGVADEANGSRDREQALQDRIEELEAALNKVYDIVRDAT